MRISCERNSSLRAISSSNVLRTKEGWWRRNACESDDATPGPGLGSHGPGVHFARAVCRACTALVCVTLAIRLSVFVCFMYVPSDYACRPSRVWRGLLQELRVKRALPADLHRRTVALTSARCLLAEVDTTLLIFNSTVPWMDRGA